MTHPLATLSREELRGWIACTRHMNTLSVRLGSDDDAMMVMEELQEVAQALLDREAPRGDAPPPAMMSTDFARALNAWEANANAASGSITDQQPWYQPADGNALARFMGTILGALRCWGIAERLPVEIVSNQWQGSRWAAILPTVEGPSEAVLTDTQAELDIEIVEREREIAGTDTEEEKAQTGLADAVAENLAEPSKAEPKAEPTKQDRALRKDSPWTEERLALLRRLFPTTMRIEAIYDALNALPGLPITGTYTVRQKADKLSLHRRGEPMPEQYAGAAASRTKQPQNAAPAAAPVVTAGPVVLTTEDMHEIRETFRKKEFGTKKLVDDYGVSEERAQEIVNKLRAEQKAKAA